MTHANDSLGGRLPLLTPDTLSVSQRKLYDQLQATELQRAKRSGFQAQTDTQELIGPFNALLRSPEIATAFMSVVSAQHQYSALSQRVQQVVILTIGAVWQAAYELYAHIIVAKKAGINEDAIQALASGQQPIGLSKEEMLAHDFTQQIATTHQIPPDLYQQALETFGEQGVVDMLVLAGHYMTVSAVLNTFAVPAPVSQ